LNELFGVAATSATNAWAVGEFFSGARHKLQTLVERWDGTAWMVEPSPNVDSHRNELFGVAATSSTDAWAVGDFFSGSTHDIQTLVGDRYTPTTAGSGSSYSLPRNLLPTSTSEG
jgi:hypothetical protein